MGRFDISYAELARKTALLLADQAVIPAKASEEFREVIGKLRSLRAQIENLEMRAENLIDENSDVFSEEIFGSNAESVLELSFESSSVSATNQILEYGGLFFFIGTDLDEKGPYTSLHEAVNDNEEFFLEREDSSVELFYREDVPKRLLWDILDAIRECDPISVNGTRVHISEPITKI